MVQVGDRVSCIMIAKLVSTSGALQLRSSLVSNSTLPHDCYGVGRSMHSHTGFNILYNYQQSSLQLCCDCITNTDLPCAESSCHPTKECLVRPTLALLCDSKMFASPAQGTQSNCQSTSLKHCAVTQHQAWAHTTADTCDTLSPKPPSLHASPPKPALVEDPSRLTVSDRATPASTGQNRSHLALLGLPYSLLIFG